tara:strand:- start:4581 stop:5036 length:456 start_codon:yes stop_codon:yes gene_type:complete
MTTAAISELCEPKKEKYSGWVESNLKGLAGDYIQLYFAELSLFNGGPIPKSLLKRAVCVSAVLNTNICDGCDKAHLSLGEPTPAQRQAVQKSGAILPNSEQIIAILNRCAKLRIPKCFAAGIMLIHLELCEGIDICLNHPIPTKQLKELTL